MNQGECDTCGNWSGALQEGMCPPCVETYKPQSDIHCGQKMDKLRFKYKGVWRNRGNFCRVCRHFDDFWPNVQGD